MLKPRFGGYGFHVAAFKTLTAAAAARVTDTVADRECFLEPFIDLLSTLDHRCFYMGGAGSITSPTR